jgi:hypothetical protein
MSRRKSSYGKVRGDYGQSKRKLDYNRNLKLPPVQKPIISSEAYANFTAYRQRDLKSAALLRIERQRAQEQSDGAQ